MRPLRALRVIPVVVVVVIIGLVGTALGPGAAVADDHHGDHQQDHHNAKFRVGAAAVDITPPLVTSGVPNPAACAAPAGYTGHHLLTLEEPYRDTNANLRHDDGEPFQDGTVALRGTVTRGTELPYRFAVRSCGRVR